MHDASRHARAASAAAFLLALGAAIFLRFYDLPVKPLHHDEGVNSFFLLNLARTGQYAYNPENYHGPTLYYFTLAALKVFGESEFALRFFPALCGSLMVAAVWLLRRWLGLVGTPAAAWALALSPGLVYFSRDFIHEITFGLFTLGVVIGAWRYVVSRRFGWVVLFAVSAGLLFATKETALHTVAVLALAAVCAALWGIGRGQTDERGFSVGRVLSEWWGEVKENWPPLDYLASALIIFLAVNVIFYSSFFTNWKGVADAVKSIFMWTGRGVKGDEHVHAFGYYLGILVKLELPLVVGSVVGGLLALRRGTRFGLFLFAWASGVVLGYSIVKYKTPWLALSMFVAMALLTGYAAQEVFARLRPGALRFAWVAVLLAAAVPCARMAWDINFKFYDDNENRRGYFSALGERLKLTAYTDTQYGYVYAQTDRSLLAMVERINGAARPEWGPKPEVHIASADYWPLPWYLRNYQIVGYGTPPADGFALPFLITSINQQEEMNAKLGDAYTAGVYKLRPGVDLVLYVRR
jgi:uncharacterized protein (TIGR03663 family)